MQGKLKSGAYITARAAATDTADGAIDDDDDDARFDQFAFAADVRQIYRNAVTFSYKPNSPCHVAARLALESFETLFATALSQAVGGTSGTPAKRARLDADADPLQDGDSSAEWNEAAYDCEPVEDAKLTRFAGKAGD